MELFIIDLLYKFILIVNGERHYMNFHNFTRDNTNKWLNFLRTRVGIKTIRFRKLQHTELPSIQGVWSPFTNKSPELNITSFPNVSDNNLKRNAEFCIILR